MTQPSGMNLPERQPAVAGSFYEGSPDRLRRQIAACMAANPPRPKESVLGAVVPHAGLMYSGHVAAAVYGAVQIPPSVILLGPNHTGLGREAAINLRGSWRTPLGAAQIDHQLALTLARALPPLNDDPLAHLREHSLEVQLPFLQISSPLSRFVPLCLATRHFEQCQEIGEAIAKVIGARGPEQGPVLLLASSDLNHYETQEVTLRKDGEAIDQILALDPRGLWDTVRKRDISMCGIIPTTTMLIALRILGASKASLLKHATSGDINHDYEHVVGYAGITIR